ncbi:ataxin-2-like protein isoform X2 [Melanotaenia boesemani]|nr:ataxin-2-like protein isoform X2 [Melanotaenia boesemani]XP_041829121.1 ataxin-2-like protein isoform X2 [Melanotaenia boesemani]XP_041829122.1 ataxin-2-like protein isoform X2 [Melanotaenia boesemani]
MSSPVSGINSSSRTPAGRNRTSKLTFQSSPVFEGVYNNARMLHFLTAVVGSTCDIRVKNGSMFEGIFKTLSSRCELAVDAVHKRTEEGSSPSAPPRREDITDTMIFSPSDLVTMICRDVDLNYATRDTFTDTAITSSRINGEHKEKVLQRWEGGDSNGESYDLENDASNGWDANEMFRYNEVKYGVTSTYDSSLSMYTVPLERGNSEVYRQREARAARLASEIESSPQYRQRVNLENEEGKSEEDKYSAVVREGNDRERGRESPRDRERERGRDSPGASNREGKYIPPQRQREMNRERAERGPGGPPPHNRLSGGYRSTPPSSSSSSPRPPLPSAAGNQPGPSPSERSSPLSGRGGAFASHHPQGSPSPGPGSGPASPYTPASPGGQAPTPTSASAATSPASPPAPHGHAVPHSHSLPHSLSDVGRPVNGVSSRTSPKAQRPPQSSRTSRNPNSHPQSTAARSPKSGSFQDKLYLDTSSVSLPTQKTSGPAPLFPVDVNEILGAAAKERSAESPSSTEDNKSSKAPSVQQMSQIEELRKFGKEFRLQPSGGSSSSPTSPAAATPPTVSEAAQSSAAKSTPSNAQPSSEPKPLPLAPSPSQPQPQPSPAPTEDASKDAATTQSPAAATTTAQLSDRQSPATPQPARTPGSEDVRSETTERTEGVADQVKKSTLNPNAKEFNPIKPQIPMTKPNTAPTPPRPTPPSPVVLQHHGGQGPLYNTPYLSYVSQIHPVQAPQMYPYAMSTVSQGKYARTKNSVVATRSDHGTSAPPMLQAAASAAGAPLVASPYPQSYLQYNPQQYGQQQVIQAITPYPGQPMYSMLQGGARMIGQGGGPHPQALGPGGPQFPTQGDGSQGPQQGIYAPQSFSHHSGAVHQPQPSSTPTGNQPPPQHAAPSPGQNAQSGPQAQSLYHSGPLSAPTPPNMPPGHTSPQGTYPIQGYSIHSHQAIPPTYPLGQIAQAHVQGPMSGPHHSGSHGQPQLVMLQPPQQGPGGVPQHGPQQGAHQHFYLGHQAMQVQTHPASFHPPGN